MRFVVLAVAVLAVVARADILEESAQLVGDDLNTFDMAIRSVDITQIASSLDSDSRVPRTSSVSMADQCGECVRDGARFIMRHVTEQVMEFCKHHGDDPRVREHCARIAAHTAVFLGLTADRVQPVSHAFAFCAGKGVCHHQSLLENSDEFVSLHFASKYMDSMQPANRTALFAMPADLPSVNPSEIVLDGRLRCEACVRRVAQHVMRGVIGHIMEFCQEHDAPFCHFARDHPGFFLGTLLGRVEPQKFGIGACIASQECPHPGQ